RTSFLPHITYHVDSRGKPGLGSAGCNPVPCSAGEVSEMYSAGLFQTMPMMRDALADPPPNQEWLDAAKDGCRRRMHSADTEALQAQVDQLRLYVAALFRLLVARGVVTVDEAQQLVAELVATGGEPGVAVGRDVVSGAELPPEENPFRGLG